MTVSPWERSDSELSACVASVRARSPEAHCCRGAVPSVHESVGDESVERMRSRKVTLEESIAALASETGASPAFVEKVRALFLGRGIDVEDSSEPYTAALVEAFRRHAAMRHRVDEARGS